MVRTDCRLRAPDGLPCALGEIHAGDHMSRRDFECCAYRSKSGKTGCGALRYYHDDAQMKKRHKFVEPNHEPTDIERARGAALEEAAKLVEGQANENWNAHYRRIAAEIRALTATDVRGTCTWTLDMKKHENAAWNTACGKSTYFSENLHPQIMKFCAFCGKPLATSER